MEQYNAKFAEVYDIFMDNTDYDAWANYIISLLPTDFPKGARIFECGCGANRASRPLRHGGPASGFGFRADGKRIVRLDGHFLYRRERDRAEQIELLGGIEYHEDMVEMA